MTAGDEVRSITATLADAAAPHETFLVGGPIRLWVTSTLPEPLTALAAAAAPYLQPARPARDMKSPKANEQIVIHTDPVMAERLCWLAGRVGEICGGVRLVRERAREWGQCREAFLLWDQAIPHTSYLVLGHPGPATDKMTLRLVRGIASRCLITARWAPLHAAAAATRARLIVLTGPSGAGKTTALLQLLADRLGHAFVANDKVYLTVSGDGVHARALPTSAALRADTAAMFPTVADMTSQASSSHANGHPEPAGTGRRLQVPPRRIAEAFGAALHPGGPVAAILAISYNGPGRPSSWRRVGPPLAIETLSTGYLGDWFIDEPHEYSRLGVPPGSLRAAHRATLRRISSTVPFFELDAGTGTPQALRAIITSLGGPAGQAEPARRP